MLFTHSLMKVIVLSTSYVTLVVAKAAATSLTREFSSCSRDFPGDGENSHGMAANENKLQTEHAVYNNTLRNCCFLR